MERHPQQHAKLVVVQAGHRKVARFWLVLCMIMISLSISQTCSSTYGFTIFRRRRDAQGSLLTTVLALLWLTLLCAVRPTCAQGQSTAFTKLEILINLYFAVCMQASVTFAHLSFGHLRLGMPACSTRVRLVSSESDALS